MAPDSASALKTIQAQNRCSELGLGLCVRNGLIYIFDPVPQEFTPMWYSGSLDEIWVALEAIQAERNRALRASS